MTRIVLLLTAIPLAAVLALILNTLLDRRVAAIAARSRRASTPRQLRSRGVWVALALLSSTAAPALASASGDTAGRACAAIDCSLRVEAALVDRLWEPARGDGVVVVAQSRIPVWLGPASEPDPEPGQAAPEGEDQKPVATAGLESR